MKHFEIILFMLLSASFITAQISTTHVVVKAKDESILSYDSTENFLTDNIERYIGQRLYLKEKREGLRKYGYSNFFVDYKNEYSLPSSQNAYKNNGSTFSRYEQMAGKYFTVLDVLCHPKAETSSFYKDIYYLKLLDEDENDVVYFKSSFKFEYDFPFIVVGFYEKQKKDVIGKKYIFTNHNLRNKINIETGDTVEFKPNEAWECVDITVSNLDYEFSILIKNAKGEKIMLPFRVIQNKHHKNSYNLHEAQKYQRKFGLINWLRILDGDVRVGFTEEMVKLSWGEPDYINRSSYSDQWVYDYDYLYFEGGILKAFN